MLPEADSGAVEPVCAPCGLALAEMHSDSLFAVHPRQEGALPWLGAEVARLNRAKRRQRQHKHDE